MRNIVLFAENFPTKNIASKMAEIRATNGPHCIIISMNIFANFDRYVRLSSLRILFQFSKQERSLKTLLETTTPSLRIIRAFMG